MAVKVVMIASEIYLAFNRRDKRLVTCEILRTFLMHVIPY